jgi:hypothetical protein
MGLRRSLLRCTTTVPFRHPLLNLRGELRLAPFFSSRPPLRAAAGESDKHLERMPAGSTGNPITPWSEGRGVLFRGCDRQKHIYDESVNILNPGLKEQDR